MHSVAAFLALLASSAVVSAIPGNGNGWSSSCITSTHCSTELCTESSVTQHPSTYVETITTYVPVTKTETKTSVIVKTSDIPESEYKTKTLTKTYTKTELLTSYATSCTTYPVVSTSLCPETTQVVTLSLIHI